MIPWMFGPSHECCNRVRPPGTGILPVPISLPVPFPVGLESHLMDMSLHRLLTFLICLLVPVSAFSDEVYLKNGDRLTGTIKTTTAGKLILETSYAGEVGIRLAAIQRMPPGTP